MSTVWTLAPEAPLSGHSLMASLLVMVGFLLGLRLCHTVRRRRHVGERVLILGTSALARETREAIERRPDLRYAVVGVVDNAKNLGRVVQATRPDRIVVGLAERRGRLPLYALLEARARGIMVEDAAETYERLTGKLVDQGDHDHQRHIDLHNVRCKSTKERSKILHTSGDTHRNS